MNFPKIWRTLTYFETPYVYSYVF